MAVSVAVPQKARVFAAFIHFHLSLIFANKGGGKDSGAPYETPLTWPCPQILG
jgi:hypothetical protein